MEQKGGLLSMLLGTLDARLLRNLLASNGVKAKIPGQEVKRVGVRTYFKSSDIF